MPFAVPYRPARRIKMKKGFTLIELLVVVLIIGILSAVALPQYQRAVAKAKLVDVLQRMKALATAQDSFYLANGEYSSDYSNLDIGVVPEDTGIGTGSSSFCYNGGCYFINSTYTSKSGVKGNYAYFWGSSPEAQMLPSIYVGFSNSAVNAGKRICCFYKNPTGQKGKIQQALCKGAGGEKVDHPVSAQSGRDDCYSF